MSSELTCEYFIGQPLPLDDVDQRAGVNQMVRVWICLKQHHPLAPPIHLPKGIWLVQWNLQTKGLTTDEFRELDDPEGRGIKLEEFPSRVKCYLPGEKKSSTRWHEYIDNSVTDANSFGYTINLKGRPSVDPTIAVTKDPIEGGWRSAQRRPVARD